MRSGKDELIHELERRVDDRILEPTNAELLRKLINNADSLDEAIMIAEPGTTYRRTGFHFDKRLGKMTDLSKFRYEDEFVETRGKYELSQTLDYNSLQYSKTMDYEIDMDGRKFYSGANTG